MSTAHDPSSAAHESAPATAHVVAATGPQEDTSPVLPAASLSALLAHSNIQGRGNGTVRQAAILQLQQTQGNRATRQLLQRRRAATAEPAERDATEAGADVAGQVAVQRDVPASAAPPQPAPAAATPLRTIDDLITGVQHVESAYPGDNWQDITTRIRKSYYDGFLWDSMIKDRENYPGLTSPPLSMPDLQAFTTARNHPEITANGDSIDIGHVFTGLDAMNFPRTGVIMSAASIEGPPGATWAGDVGSALAEWDLSAPRDRNRRADYYDRYASRDDMLGDVDGIALSQVPSGGGTTGGSGTLSDRLRAYYRGSAGTPGGVGQRFTKFAQASGFHWTGRGAAIQLDQVAKDHIRSQIDNFGVQWRRQHGGYPGANWFHDEDLDWFRDRFVTWVQQGLAAENP